MRAGARHTAPLGLLLAGALAGLSGRAGAQEEAPSTATLVHYNARMALREGQADEAVRLWLLRNALVEQDARVAAGDADQRAVTWAALGALGLCPEGLERDEDGPGLWPLATHNWVVANLGRRARPNRGQPFEAFLSDRQQRAVAVTDVLDAEELIGLKLSRGRCGAAAPLLVEVGGLPWDRLDDGEVAMKILLHLLERAERTLDPARVRGRAAVAARRFDLHLALAAESQAPAQQVLDDAKRWPVDEWMSLSEERRLFLFDQTRARALAQDPEGAAAMDGIALGVVDAVLAQGRGREAARWIARLQQAGDPPWQQVWGGARGQALIALGDEAGLGERSVLALHRGVHALQQDQDAEALRLLAFARAHSGSSAAADTVAALSRRWLHHAAGRYALGGALLPTVQPILSRADFLELLEDLAWRAALVGDAAGLSEGMRHLPARAALERRTRLLAPLARGETSAFLRAVDLAMTEAPGEALRFLDQLVQRVEAEDLAVRQRNRPALEGVVRLLRRQPDGSGGPSRRVQATLARAEALLRGLDSMEEAVAGSQGGELFAGSVRLAPADPLPWPFLATPVAPPPVLTPLRLVPVEWRDARGELILGWSIGG